MACCTFAKLEGGLIFGGQAWLDISFWQGLEIGLVVAKSVARAPVGNTLRGFLWRLGVY